MVGGAVIVSVLGGAVIVSVTGGAVFVSGGDVAQVSETIVVPVAVISRVLTSVTVAGGLPDA